HSHSLPYHPHHTHPSTPIMSLLLVLYSPLAPPHLHSFPTRRSSDLTAGTFYRRVLAPWRTPAIPHRCVDHLAVRNDVEWPASAIDRKSTRLNSSHVKISYAVFCLKKKKNNNIRDHAAEHTHYIPHCA